MKNGWILTYDEVNDHECVECARRIPKRSLLIRHVQDVYCPECGFEKMDTKETGAPDGSAEK